MHHYSQEVKEAMVTKLCSPGGPSYSQLAAKSGIALSTLHEWVKRFGDGEQSHLSKRKRPQDWSLVERLEVVFEALSFDEAELGEFLRRKGLHTNNIQEWKTEALAESSEKSKRGRPKLDPELVALRQETTNLKRDLRRKEKALAEAAALIMLKKRAEEIWGKDEDDE